MLRRCYDEGCPGYKDYGGRGIEVCQRWRDDFRTFAADMGARPELRTLDRVDNERGYGPDNCRWATYEQQATNRRCSSAPCAAYRASLEAELAELRRMVLGC